MSDQRARLSRQGGRVDTGAGLGIKRMGLLGGGIRGVLGSKTLGIRKCHTGNQKEEPASDAFA